MDLAIRINILKQKTVAMLCSKNQLIFSGHISLIMIFYESIVTIMWRHKFLTSVRLVTVRTLETAGVAGKESGNKRTGSLGTTSTIIYQKRKRIKIKQTKMKSDRIHGNSPAHSSCSKNTETNACEI